MVGSKSNLVHQVRAIQQNDSFLDKRPSLLKCNLEEICAVQCTVYFESAGQNSGQLSLGRLPSPSTAQRGYNTADDIPLFLTRHVLINSVFGGMDSPSPMVTSLINIILGSFV